MTQSINKPARYKAKLNNRREFLLRRATQIKEDIRKFRELADSELEDMKFLLRGMREQLAEIDDVLNKRIVGD